MIRFATIGTSNITEEFLDAASNCKDFKYEASYSRDINKAKEFATKHGAVKYYDSLEEIGQDKDIDAVYIASPNSLHCNHAIKMMEMGKHVLCEKPFSLSPEDTKLMFDVAKKNGVVLMEAMRPVHDPGVEMLKELIDTIGDIHMVELSFCQLSSRFESFKKGDNPNIFNPKMGGGALYDLGVYDIETLLYLFGAPKGLTASNILLENGVIGAGMITAEYPGMIANLKYSKIHNENINSYIAGEKGTIYIPMFRDMDRFEVEYTDGTKKTVKRQECANNMLFELEDFIAAIEKEKDLTKYKELSLLTAEHLEMAGAEG